MRSALFTGKIQVLGWALYRKIHSALDGHLLQGKPRNAIIIFPLGFVMMK